MATNDLTPNQEKVVNLTSDFLRKDKRIIKGKILKKSGYKKSIQESPSIVYKSDGVKAGLKPIIEQLKALRQKTIDAINSKKLPKEKLADNTNLLRNLNHDIELLEGNPTERIEETQITPQELKDYIKYRKSKEKWLLPQ